MKKIIFGFAAAAALVGSIAFAATVSVSSPTCTLSVSPTPIELLRSTPTNITWTSTGGDIASIKVDAWSQPNIYTNNSVPLNGNITVPILASMGTAVTLTVTKYTAPYSQAICKLAVPLHWTVR